MAASSLHLSSGKLFHPYRKSRDKLLEKRCYRIWKSCVCSTPLIRLKQWCQSQGPDSTLQMKKFLHRWLPHSKNAKCIYVLIRNKLTIWSEFGARLRHGTPTWAHLYGNWWEKTFVFLRCYWNGEDNRIWYLSSREYAFKFVRHACCKYEWAVENFSLDRQ